MRNFSRVLLLMAVALFAFVANAQAQESEPLKREFRGAWIQAVNGQFQNMGEQQMKEYLVTMLDNLQKANVNAIIFQVRVEGDALYNSPYEPWTRYHSYNKPLLVPSPNPFCLPAIDKS